MADKLTVVGGVVLSGGGKQVLLLGRQYGPHGWWYSFPGGKVEPGETLEQALERECREEIGCCPGRVAKLRSCDGTAPDGQPLILTAFLIPNIRREEVRLGGEYSSNGGFVWADVETCERLFARGRVLPATAEVLRFLIGGSWIIPNYLRPGVESEKAATS